MSDEERPIAENESVQEVEQTIEAPKEVEQVQDAPLTKEAFSAQMQQLAKRARVAGLRPLQVMAQTYAKRGMTLLEGLLDSLEDDDSSKKKKA